ncbi:FG-GAP repeat domain-containing protein [Streptomyces sp. NPDC003023]|uniref:FG-GAP repeat domain-containing protein n=1 Tax=Streptomyces sp. NPDC003023 TaxID=3364675 RepID=UPI00368DF863
MNRGRAVSTRRSAGRRIAACTSLALAAGMLLAVPASADEAPAHRSVGEQPREQAAAPNLTLPDLRTDKNRSGVSSESVEGALAVARPRSDLNDDGASDMLYRTVNGDYRLALTGGGGNLDYSFEYSTESFADVFSIAGLDSTAADHATVFTVSSRGVLTAYKADPYFADAYWSGAGWQIYNKVFSPGDLTGDGVGDVLARTPGGELWIYAGTADKATPLAPRVKVGNGWNGYDQLVGVNDVNGDAIADLYARTPSGDLYFYSGTSEIGRPFKGRVKAGWGYDIYNTMFSTDDIDGDGLGDVFGRTLTGTLYYYISDGTGNFKPRQVDATGWNEASQFAGAGNNPAWGKNDVMGVDKSGVLWAYYGMNNGLLSQRYEVGSGWQGAKLTLASSHDNDGYADLFEVYNGGLYNLSYGSEGGYLGSGWQIYNTLVGPGDLSGDGKGDLLARDSSGVLWLYQGNGNGSAVAPRIKIGAGWNGYNAIVGAGDITGDGRADIVARTPAGQLYLYKGHGQAGWVFESRQLIGGGWQGYNKLVAPGDITGDGRADLLATTSGGTLYRYDADGKSPFKPRVSIGSSWNTYASLH